MSRLKTKKLISFSIFINSDIVKSIFYGTSSFFTIFSIRFFQGKTDFFYQADSLFELASYHAFMNSEFNFPLFNTEKIFPNQDFSLIWLSSTEVYFFFLKIFKSIFNIYTFNPFPLYYYLNFLIFSYVIQKIVFELKIRNFLFVSIFHYMILLNPVFINRIVFHLGLITHWIIFIVIYFSIKVSRGNYTKLNNLASASGFSIYLHPYLAFMCSIIFFFYSIFVLLRKKTNYLISAFLIYISIIASYFLLILPPSLLAGGNDSYRGAWSAEFNSFFCGKIPNSFISSKLWCYRPYINYDHEGYLYLGLGVIFGLIFLLSNLKIFNKIIFNYFPLFASSFFLLILSFGNKWKIAHKQIFEFEPNFAFRLILDSFRSNGRLGWVFYYCIFIAVLFSVYKLKPKILSYIVLLVVFSLQVYDLQGNYLKNEINTFNNNEVPTEFINTSYEILKNNNELLHIYPDDRCFHYENFYYENDPYLFAIVHLSNGGSIDTSRLGRYSGKYADRKFCDDYEILNEIENDKPRQFVILKNFYVSISHKIVNYSCSEIQSYMQGGKILLYCKVNV
tara:strand:+ start:1353 stop:3038 length:1686 start_codon:yes stop_codon:yes gene_type:complete